MNIVKFFICTAIINLKKFFFFFLLDHIFYSLEYFVVKFLVILILNSITFCHIFHSLIGFAIFFIQLLFYHIFLF